MTDCSYIQKDFWEFFKEAKATSFAGVPYTYEILKKLRFERMELPSLRYATQAGGRLSKDLVAEFSDILKNKDKSFYVMYGSTEATARMSYLEPEDSIVKSGSIGKPIPNGRFVINDDNGSEITKPHTTGRLYYSGDNVCMGYAESKEDLNLPDENKGILSTGDIAYFDEDGFYFIAGREKRFVKLYGNRVNLDEIESLLRINYSNFNLACGGNDDYMVIYAQLPIKNNDMIQFLAKTTSINARAFSLKWVEKIPRNASGKIEYAKLQEL